MNEPQRPLLWFLWPRPHPHRPLDGRASQTRLVRVTPRGPLRMLLLGAGSLITVGLCATAVLAALGGPLTLGTLVGAALAATAVLLLLRGWVVGTYVNDDGVVIERTFSRRSLPWRSIAAVSCTAGRAPLIGMPVHVRSTIVTLALHDGSDVATHVYTTSPDLVARPEAFDMARLRVENWLKKA